jgi:hypothetical protein
LGDEKEYEKSGECVQQKKNAHRSLGECPEREKLGISRRGMEYNIKMCLNEMVWENTG